MKYNLSGPTFDFVFNGYGLAIGQDYTLICLDSGTANEDGNVHIMGSVETDPLPDVKWSGLRLNFVKSVNKA
jgi:hypothetical protein